jgi:peptide-methionine (S)-S-oxide reductase
LFPQEKNFLQAQNKMKYVFYIPFFAFGFSFCAGSQNEKMKIPVGSTVNPAANEKAATFAEGCFWHSEIIFQSLEGVRDAVSGYAGGTVSSPAYDEVSAGKTGHAEAVQVYYDPSKISFATLVKAFFASHDPTTPDRQGNDVGTQYRSMVFYRNDEEKKIIQEELALESKRYKNKIVTQVLPFTVFYPAESYHQEYVSKHPDEPYVKNISVRDYLLFRSGFSGPFKKQ